MVEVSVLLATNAMISWAVVAKFYMVSALKMVVKVANTLQSTALAVTRLTMVSVMASMKSSLLSELFA